MDRHALWRNVEHDYRECVRRRAPGYYPVVEVTIAGLDKPMVLGFVRTRRDPGYPWVRFESEVRGVDGDPDAVIPPECHWVHAHESAVLGVEIRFRETDTIPSDFTFVEEP